MRVLAVLAAGDDRQRVVVALPERVLGVVDRACPGTTARPASRATRAPSSAALADRRTDPRSSPRTPSRSGDRPAPQLARRSQSPARAVGTQRRRAQQRVGRRPEHRRRHRSAIMPRVLRTVTATRYVTPLREGGSLPGIVEADDDGLYVLKFRGAGQGPKALAAEIVAGELARDLGPAGARAGADRARPGARRAEPDPEIQELIAASARASTSASTSCPARCRTTRPTRRTPSSPPTSCGSTRSSPTSTARRATRTCCAGTATCG